MANVYDGMTRTHIKMVKDELKVQWTYNSNSIEGNTISEGDTAFIIEYGLTVKGKSVREHNEVLGHSRAIDIIYNYLDSDILTLQNIFDLHTAIQTNIVIDIECPIMDIWIDEFKNTKAEDLSLEESIKKYTRSHISFTSIHPFFDGNGRVARLLANIPMLKNGYLPLIISVENRDKYIKLLSEYNLSVDELNSKSNNLMEENQHFEELYKFFISEYKNSKIVLDALKSKLR